MKTLLPLIAVAALADISPARALPGQPAQRLQALANATVVGELATQRVGTPSRHHGPAHPHAYRYRGGRYPYRGTYEDYRRDLSPPSTATPMERVPQVAPLAPRIGQ
jgi:hypothetical protein